MVRLGRGSAMFGKLSIESSEARVFAWGAAALFFLGWADVSVKNVAETFFLKRVGVERLPLVFLINSALLVVTTAAVGRLVVDRDRLRLLPRLLGGLGVALLPLWLLVIGNLTGAFALLMIASKQLTSVALMVFWIAIGDLLHGRQAKRLFAPMMAGVTLGTIVGSFASEPLGRLLGIHGLLPFSAGALGLCGAMTLPLRRLRPSRLERGPTAARAAPFAGRSRDEAGLGRLWRESGLFRLLFAIALCSGLLGPMLYFQFSYVADLATAGEGGEERLLAFYAQFRGWISVGILAAQLAVTARLYRHIGVPLAAVLSPVVYFLGFVGLSVRLSLPAGVGALAGTKLTDNAVYDPALRILFNLFPEATRARVTALLEGPVKRAGGALGNVAILAALGVGSATWVGYSALPIAALWTAAALSLWRAYPALLLQASAGRRRLGEAFESAELIDPTTLRALGPRLVDPELERCRIAIELVSDARPDLAVRALAQAARDAPDATRPMLVAALDRVLERSVAEPVASLEAARALEPLLADHGALGDRDRADVVQAVGRLTLAAPDPAWARGLLEGALGDPAPAVRLAAAAALCRRGHPPEGSDLDGVLAAAIGGDDAIARRIAREELRALLLGSDPDERWGARLARLTELLAHRADRAETAEAIAEVALRHGARAAVAGEAMLRLRDDPDPRVRAALLRFVGRAGLLTEVPWLLEHVAGDRTEGAEEVRTAATEGLRALGPQAADLLLVELGCGKRSTRNAILPIVRELAVEEEALRSLFGREVESLRRTLVHLAALREEPRAEIVVQRLGERVAEGSHTALLLLAAIRDEDRIAELGDQMRRAGDRRARAILLEALDATLGPEEKAQLMPLFDERALRHRGRAAAVALGVQLPSRRQAVEAVLEDPDELTRTLAAAAFASEGDGRGDLAGHSDLEDDSQVLSPIEILLHLKSLPIFEHLTTRQLMDLAKLVREETHPTGTVVVREGEYSNCMYLIVEGEVAITKGETLLQVLGPRSFFGEIAIFEGASRSATAETRSRVRLLCLKRDDLFHLMEELPAIAIGICRTLSRRVRELSDRVGS